MIDITKFEGHTAGPWVFDDVSAGIGSTEGMVSVLRTGAASSLVQADANGGLIAAAPDLLAEVIRLRTALYSIDRQLGHDDVDDAVRDLIDAAIGWHRNCDQCGSDYQGAAECAMNRRPCRCGPDGCADSGCAGRRQA